MEGPDCDQSQLLDDRVDDGARTAEAIRYRACHRDHHAGYLRRGLSGCAIHGHQCQRDSFHWRRRREDAAGDAEDPGHAAERSHRTAEGQGKRALQSCAGGGWPHRDRIDRACSKPSKRTSSRLSSRFGAFLRSAICPAHRLVPCNTCRKPTVRSRAKMSSAIGAWPPMSDACALVRFSITNSSPWDITRCEELPEPPF